MPRTESSKLKFSFIALAWCIAAYLTFSSYGGYLVFGFRNLAEFCFIAAPVFSLTMALLGFRYPAISATLSLAIVFLFYGAQLYHFGPPLSAILHNDPQLFKFLSVTGLLGMAAFLDHLSKRSRKPTAGT